LHKTVKEIEKFLEDCIEEYELFKDDGEFIYSESLLRRMGIKDDIREKRRGAARVRWDKEKDKKDASALHVHSNSNAGDMQDYAKEKKINKKESKKKVNEIKSKEKEINDDGDAIILPPKDSKDFKDKEPKYGIESEYYQMAFYLRGKVHEIHPKNNLPKDTPIGLEKWANTIRIMCEQDNRTLEDASKVLNFAFNDEFWSGVIQSPKALRKNFDLIGAKVFKATKSESFIKSATEGKMKSFIEKHMNDKEEEDERN